MNTIRKFAIQIVVLLTSFGGNAQTDLVDSLIGEIPHVKGEEKVYLLSDISYYLSGNDNERAVKYARDCLKTAETNGDQQLIAEGYNALGIALYSAGDFREALSANESALAIRKKLKDDKGMMASWNKIANCYTDLGDYPKSIENNIKALRIAEAHQWNAYVGMIVMNIGVVYKEQRNFQKALFYYDKAIKAAKSVQDTLSWGRALNNKAVVLRELDDIPAALETYQKALELVEGRGQLDLESGLLLNLGALESTRHNEVKALEYYQRALPLSEAVNDQHNMAILYANIGNRLVDAGNWTEAERYLKKSIKLCKRLGLKKQEAESLEGLGRYYIVTGDFKQAYEVDQLADSLRDELLNAENARAVEELNVKYETEKQEKQLAEQQIDLKEKDNRLQRFTFISVIIVLFLLIAYLFVVLRQRRLRQRLELEKEQAKSSMQEEKLRISRELHDNIGAQLTFVITSLESTQKKSAEAETKDKIGRVREQAKQTMNELREAIWTIQSDEVALRELLGKVAGFVQGAKTADRSVRVNNLLSETRLEAKLSPEQAIAIFRVVQEAVNNAVKHSGSDLIEVNFTDDYISVRDYGKGFDPGEVLGGFGLTNMKTRLEAVGLKLTLVSDSSGTAISIFI